MSSAMDAVRANALHKQLITEKERIIDIFAGTPSAKCRAVTKVTKMILLNGPYMLHGKFWEVKAKSLGAGVYELSIERKEM